jgi:hypothetical protein
VSEDAKEPTLESATTSTMAVNFTRWIADGIRKEAGHVEAFRNARIELSYKGKADSKKNPKVIVQFANGCGWHLKIEPSNIDVENSFVADKFGESKPLEKASEPTVTGAPIPSNDPNSTGSAPVASTTISDTGCTHGS